MTCENYQGNAVVNYTDREVPYTRIIEHKHFEFGNPGPTDSHLAESTLRSGQPGIEPYYPVNDEREPGVISRNTRNWLEQEKNVIFGGRMGNYKYYDMDKVIAAALETVKEELD